MSGDGHEFCLRSDEQCIALTRDFRLIQKRRGHRYTVDDMLVAHLAGTFRGSARRVLDLGCGLGSVLLITAWAYPTASLVGLEILAEHVAFAKRNLGLNGCQARARVVAGDLRDDALVKSLGAFDLVTGSPPYFALRSGTLCADPARAAAHFEMNGGIEAYALAAAQALDPEGIFVTCARADSPKRNQAAFRQAGLTLLYHQEVLPRAGKEPFLTLLVGAQHTPPLSLPSMPPPLVLRQNDGHRTAQHRAIRDWTGVPSKNIC